MSTRPNPAVSQRDRDALEDVGLPDAVIPLLATLQSRRQSKRQSMRIGVFGVRRAMATRNQFRAEVGAAELTPNTRRTLCFSSSHDTETRPAPRLTLPQCSRRRAMR